MALPMGWLAVSQGSGRPSNSRTYPPLFDGILRSPRTRSISLRLLSRSMSGPSGRRARRGAGDGLSHDLPTVNLPAGALDATVRYITMYERLIGPYPYGKFALVENFWETGYGMPSFTLLGPQVIRFPFILTSSYPARDPPQLVGQQRLSSTTANGNWCEGLTAYLADHLIKEQQGAGRRVPAATPPEIRGLRGRRSADFPAQRVPLAPQRSQPKPSGTGNRSCFSTCCGCRLGDEKFISGLRDFYLRNRFRTASSTT
ncbi:MAG: hypothetical protein MZV70_59395 [Desulfobacterales bacterium]|nr:hypothetical protein [Desulfobacterales bacterium]